VLVDLELNLPEQGMSDVNDLPDNCLPTDGNRPPVSGDAEALTANRTPGHYPTNDGNGTPSMTNVRRSVAGFVGDTSAIRTGSLPAMRPSDSTAAGRFDCPSVWSFLDGVSTSRFHSHAALRSVGDGSGLPASLSDGTAVSRYRDPSAVTYANGVGGHLPTMNIVDGYTTATAGSLLLTGDLAVAVDTRR